MRLNENNTFIGINPPYQLSVIHSSKLIYPREIYQRGVERKRVELIARDFNEYIVNEPNVSFRNGRDTLQLARFATEGAGWKRAGAWPVDELLAVDEEAGKVYFRAGVESPLRSEIHAVPLAGGAPVKLSHAAGMHSAAFANNASVYVDSWSNSTTPPQIELYRANGEKIATLLDNDITDPQHPYAKYRAAQQPVEYGTLAAADGKTELHYSLIRPTGFDAAKKYPVALLIHGGPQGSFGDQFHYRWNPQTYAGRGYVALMIDFHGSTGYGQAFTDAINGDWGGKPLDDLKLGLAAALEKYPWMDGERVAALGGSYGGYMVNWIAGQMPDRFKALVTHAGNLDERFAYFATEELWFPEWEHGGTPWENPDGFTKHNPIDYVKNWKTPTLVIHGAKDFRVVETGGFATFTALQRKGIPSRFLYFPDENHWILKPANSILWHDTVLDWLDQWMRAD